MYWLSHVPWLRKVQGSDGITVSDTPTPISVAHILCCSKGRLRLIDHDSKHPPTQHFKSVNNNSTIYLHSKYLMVSVSALSLNSLYLLDSTTALLIYMISRLLWLQCLLFDEVFTLQKLPYHESLIEIHPSFWGIVVSLELTNSGDVSSSRRQRSSPGKFRKDERNE